ncbi:MAG: ester cyclase [bacterium]
MLSTGVWHTRGGYRATAVDASEAGMDDHRARTLAVNDATYAAWNAHDADAVAAVFAEDPVVREIVGAGESGGRDAVRARAAALMAAFPDLRLERVALVIDGDHHADRWILSGTHRGELFGFAPTGKAVRVEGATFSRLGRDGLVIEDVHLSDVAGLLAQLSG